MDVVLHCGAHRTNASGLQSYLARHGDALLARKVDVCPLDDSDAGLFANVMPFATAQSGKNAPVGPNQAIEDRLATAADRGADTLFVTDVHLLGDVAQLVRDGSLYADAGMRLSRCVAAFSGLVREVVISTRSPESFWISILSAAVAGGAPVPNRKALRAIAFNSRSWRDVISDVARAVPGVRVRVVPFEHYQGRPEQILARSLGCELPFDRVQPRQNRAPQLPELRRLLAERGGAASDLPFGMGRWNPFCAEELAAMRELYADDLMWLVGGADGLATMTEDPTGTSAAQRPPAGYQVKGQCNGKQERRMARPG